jgi:hypothetical protein
VDFESEARETAYIADVKVPLGIDCSTAAVDDSIIRELDRGKVAIAIGRVSAILFLEVGAT